MSDHGRSTRRVRQEGARRDSGSKAAVPPLSQIYFYLTEGCNLACRHCWLSPRRDADARRTASLPVELFEQAIREAKPLGLTKAKLTGGEPLLHPQITSLLQLLEREKIEVTIETNGVLCTPELARCIARTSRPFVSVSLDGADAATHDWVRGVAGSFDKAVAALRHLVAAGMRPQVILTVMRRNAHQADRVVRLAERLGAGSVKFNLLQPTARGEWLHERGEAASVEELVAIGRHVEGELASSTPLRLYFDYPLAFRPLSRLDEDGATCGISGILGVLSSGHYALCGIGMHVKELVFGRVGQDALSRVWRHEPVLNEIRRGLPGRLEGVCGRCVMKHRCLGACLAQNYYRSRRFWAPFWFCEEAERIGLFPNTRFGLTRPGHRTGTATAVDSGGTETGRHCGKADFVLETHGQLK